MVSGFLIASHAIGRWGTLARPDLRAQGRRSYEIYLTHMFVVYSLVALFKASGGDMRSGWLWFPPTVLLCWALGELVARRFSDPVERALRACWLGGVNGSVNR